MLRFIAQKIGVYYISEEWRNKVYDEFIKSIPPELIVRKCVSKHEVFINLKDGTSIRFIPANDNARGYKFSKILMEPAIDYDVYTSIIMPCHMDMKSREEFIYDGENMEVARYYYNKCKHFVPLEYGNGQTLEDGDN